MTGEKLNFKTLESYNGGTVTFGSNQRKSHIVGLGTVGNENLTISNVYLVDGLNYNLMSVSKLCDAGFYLIFDKQSCNVYRTLDNVCVYKGQRKKNVYYLYMNHFTSGETCFSAHASDSWLWHRRLGHVAIDSIGKLAKRNLVRGLPKHKLHIEGLCDTCMKGKQVKTSFKSKDMVSTTEPLQLIHMDLFGPISVPSLSRKRYVFVIVDDYSRYTWVLFLASKDETVAQFIKFSTMVENEKKCKIIRIRSDHGREFENNEFDEFCSRRGYKQEYSAPRTPQQNGVVERKNRTLQEVARTMLNEYALPKYLWAEAVNTACYVVNRVSMRPILKKTPYELWKGRTPNISHFKVFGSKCFVLNETPKVTKFDSKTIEGIFVGYANASKAYRIYVPNHCIVIESINVKFDERTNEAAWTTYNTKSHFKKVSKVYHYKLPDNIQLTN